MDFIKQENENILNPSRLRLRGTFENQVQNIFQTMKMSKKEYNIMTKTVYNDVKNTLNEIWEGCKVEAFGSVVAGLGLKSSDADYYVDLPSPEIPVNCIHKIKHFLNRNSTPFRYLAENTRAKIPIISLLHEQTNIHCDISFSGPIAVKIGKLFSYLFNNHNARQLALLVKYWSKVHQLVGTKLLPSNAMIDLVIFFLQREEILLSVAELQDRVRPEMTDGWNTAFERKSQPNKTTKSLYELLGDFFQFYSDYNFTGLVVSPYLGYPVDWQNFSNINNVPPEFNVYREHYENTGDIGNISIIKSLNVQCPFNHSRNIAVGVKPWLANKITNCFRDAAEIYRNYPKHEFLNRILHTSESDISNRADTINTYEYDGFNFRSIPAAYEFEATDSITRRIDALRARQRRGRARLRRLERTLYPGNGKGNQFHRKGRKF